MRTKPISDLRRRMLEGMAVHLEANTAKAIDQRDYVAGGRAEEPRRPLPRPAAQNPKRLIASLPRGAILWGLCCRHGDSRSLLPRAPIRDAMSDEDEIATYSFEEAEALARRDAKRILRLDQQAVCYVMYEPSLFERQLLGVGPPSGACLRSGEF
jgi:hypothetical protein